MHRVVMCMAVLCLASTSVLAQSATDVTNADVQKVLKDRPDGDHTIKVVDMGDGTQQSIAVIHRGPTGGPPAAPNPAAAAARAKAPACGLKAAPAGAKVTSFGGMLSHHDTSETYIVIAGSGTLVTGGQILNGTESAPDADVTTTLNGPTCSGKATGNFVSRVMHVGDVSVMPAGTPHGWSDIGTEVTYLSVRYDPKKVLPKGYVYPALKK